MKRFILLPVLYLLLSGFTPGTIHFEEVVNSLSKGQVSGVVVLLDEQVKLTLDHKRMSLDKSEAASRITDFFSKHPIRGFRLIHQVNGRQATLLVGEILTSSSTYRTTWYLSEEGGKTTIQEIRFE